MNDDRITLAQTQEEFDTQAKKVLTDLGFDVSDDTLRFYGQYIQLLPDGRDYIYAIDLAEALRAAKAKMLAYNLIMSTRKAKNDGTPEAPGA